MVARYDQTTDPQIIESLLLARRGTAYFSRYLGQLTAEDLRSPSLIPGWNRAHVVAHVGYHARELAHLIEEVRTGLPQTETELPQAYDVDYGATLPEAALRNLHAHAAVHLNVEWRDLPADRWDAVVLQDGRPSVHVAETAWTRACEVWVRAVDLDVGARFEDFPPRLLERLLHDALDDWKERSDREFPQLVLRTTDRNADCRIPQTTGTSTMDAEAILDHAVILEGTLAALTRWCLGRGTAGVLSTEEAVPVLHPWVQHVSSSPSHHARHQ